MEEEGEGEEAECVTENIAAAALPIPIPCISCRLGTKIQYIQHLAPTLFSLPPPAGLMGINRKRLFPVSAHVLLYTKRKTPPSDVSPPSVSDLRGQMRNLCLGGGRGNRQVIRFSAQQKCVALISQILVWASGK